MRNTYYFLVPDAPGPSGGINVIFALVEALQANGFKASILHGSSSRTYRFSGLSVPAAYTRRMFWPLLRRFRARYLVEQIVDLLSSLGGLRGLQAATIGPSDVIVVPEFLMNEAVACFPECRKVLLVQGPFIYLDQLAANPAARVSDYMSYVSTSSACTKVLRTVGVQDVHEIGLGIDTSLFHFQESKLPRIAYMPRRLKVDSARVMELLRRRGMTTGFEIVAIDGLAPRSVANLLRESLIFLSFQRDEGFGLPPAEAMSCGCIVIGYVGQGSADYFDHTTGVVVQDGDLFSYVEAIESVVEEYRRSPGRLDQLRRSASASVLGKYNSQTWRQTCVDAFRIVDQTL
jgi:hypothetical protein